MRLGCRRNPSAVEGRSHRRDVWHDVKSGQGRCHLFLRRELPKSRRIPEGGRPTPAEFFARVGKFPQVRALLDVPSGCLLALFPTSERGSGGHRLCSGIGATDYGGVS